MHNNPSDRDELLIEKSPKDALHDADGHEPRVLHFEVNRVRRQSITTYCAELENARSRLSTEEAMNEAEPSWITGRRLFAVQTAILLS